MTRDQQRLADYLLISSGGSRKKAPNRLEIKRNRDRLQADVVQELLDAGMLLSEAAAVA